MNEQYLAQLLTEGKELERKISEFRKRGKKY
jgi:hypothetical protein